MVSHHLAMFGETWSIAKRDIANLISQVTSQNQVTKAPCEFMGESFLC